MAAASDGMQGATIHGLVQTQTSIHVLLHSGSRGPAGASTSCHGPKAGNTLDKFIAGLHRRTKTNNHSHSLTHTHTQGQLGTNLEFPIGLTRMSLDCWRKPGKPDRHRVNIQLHTERPGGWNSQPYCYEALVLITAPPCRQRENLKFSEGEKLASVKHVLTWS